MNNKTLFPPVLEAGSLEAGSSTQCGCYSGSSPGCRQLTSWVSSYRERGSGALWGPFYRSTNPILKALILMIPQRPRLLIPTTWISVVLHRPVESIDFCKNYVFQRIDPFHSGFQICGHRVIHNII